VSGDLFGHGFAKIDRAGAEQGVEIRCPLLDLDLMAYARSLPSDRLFGRGQTKALLKEQLVDWPTRFLERRKVGLAYHLRWQWLLTNYDGLREGVDPALVDLLAPHVPLPLRKHPGRWTARGIHRHFQFAYALLALSRVIGNYAAGMRGPIARVA
jgi:hypothetical protein